MLIIPHYVPSSPQIQILKEMLNRWFKCFAIHKFKNIMQHNDYQALVHHIN